MISYRQILLCVALAAAPALALADATITGRVTDSTGEQGFSGARVTLNPGDWTAATDRAGRFRFVAVPAGDYTLVVNYVGAEPVATSVTVPTSGAIVQDVRIGEDAARLDNILVVGQAAGQAAALNQQRTADNLKRIVSSDAIGQFPDQNVTEAAQRVAGVSITRDQGEGRFIVIRGLDPNLNATTINGLRVPSAENDAREVALDVIPSDVVEQLVVTKTLTPDMDADSIGGSVEITGLSAFDRGARSGNARAEASYNDLEGDWSPKLSGNYTQLFSLGDGTDNFGVAVSGSWFDRDFGSDNLETGGGWEGVELPEGTERILPSEPEQRDYIVNRERLALSVNLDFRPDANNEYYLRTLWSDFNDDETRRANIFDVGGGEVDSVGGARDVSFVDTEVQREIRSREETQNITSLAFGGINRFDLWEIDYEAGYSQAEEENFGLIEAVFVGDAAFDLNVPGGELYQITPGDDTLFDPFTYELDEAEFSNSLTEDEEVSLELNVLRNFDWGGNPSFVKFGGKLRQREKFNDEQVFVYEGFGGDFTLNDFLFNGTDWSLGQFGPNVNPGTFNPFFLDGRSGFELDEEATAIDSTAADYSVDEDVMALYLMGRTEIGPLMLLAGVRWEDTDFDARGTQVLIDEETGDGSPVFSPVNVSNSYDNFFPSFHTRYRINDKWQARASWTTGLARPNFAFSAPFQIIEIEEDDGEFERVAEIGNPFLEPLEANNLDASIEFYPGDIGQFSAGVFYKDIENFIVVTNVAGTAPFEDFDEVFQPINGDDADVWGIELSWAQRLDFLDGPWDGLLFGANYTYTDTEANVPFRQSTIPLPRSSENVFNFVAGYEKHGLSLRFAVNYRDEYFDEIEDPDDPAQDRYVDDHIQYDLQARYSINPMWQVYLEWVNIDDEPFYAYFGDPSRNSQYETYGWTAQAGVRFFLF